MHRNINISVSTWNCLADCYAKGISAGKLKNANDFLPWAVRAEKICQVIQDDGADIICLQEVDKFENTFKPCLSSLGYRTIYLIRPGREDGVLIAFKREKFELVAQELVYFDDLAEVKIPYLSVSQRARLKKQNVAIILLLKTRTAPNGDDTNGKPCSFTVCTTHLYWNPVSPLVKLAQTVYLLERIARVRNDSGLLPSASVLTGDFNSLPQSQAYERVLCGIPFPVHSQGSPPSASEKACEVLSTHIQRGNVVRFICDATLGRLARWLRLLGVDTALEDTASQDKRSMYNDYTDLFEKARSEHRIIVTTSIGMMKRAACPETFLVKTTKSGGLETCLAKLLNFYNVKLNKSDFLTVCGKCGGCIETCERDDPRLEGKETPMDRNLFVCSKCYQVYWRSNSQSGSCLRALRLAEKLFSIVQADRHRTSRKVNGFADQGMKEDSALQEQELLSDLDCEDVRKATPDESQAVRTLHQSWLRYASAFVLAKGREPDYTNINGTFRGTLDYIFLGGACYVDRVAIREGSCSKIFTKKSFPNSEWPSDHMLVRADIVLRSTKRGRLPFSRALSLPEAELVRW